MIDLISKIHDVTYLNIIGFVVLAVDCKVGKWEPWSQCNPSCGPGTRIRKRGIIQQRANGGNVCPALTEKAPCNIKSCRKNSYFMVKFVYPVFLD